MASRLLSANRPTRDTIARSDADAVELPACGAGFQAEAGLGAEAEDEELEYVEGMNFQPRTCTE